MKLPGILTLLFLLLILGLLPSCGTGALLTGTLTYRDPQSGAKAGMVFSPGVAPRATLKVPIYDKASGDLVGMAELAGEIPVRGTK